MSERSVQKFGGSSASQPEQIAEIFTADPARNRVAVVSAIGKEPGGANGYPKVTDALVELEAAMDRGDGAAVRQAQEFVIARNRQVYSMLETPLLDRIVDDAYKKLGQESRADGFQWVGEHLSAQLLAALTGAQYLRSDLKFSGGVLHVPDSLEAIRHHVLPLLRHDRQIVVPGFFGHDTTTGEVHTLPRGGSDTTGVLYTAALAADSPDHHWLNENYTDKDGVLGADPYIVPDAQVIPEMTHDEMREKMHGITERNGVVHGNAIAYAARLGVEMQVKNTFNPSAPGTRITAVRESDPNHPVIGITGKSDLVAINAYDMGMADAENYVSPILTRVGELGMSWSNIPTGEDRLKIIFNSGVTDDNLQSLETFMRDRAISGDKSRISIKKNQGAVYIVGQELVEPLAYTKVMGRVATALSAAELPMREVVSHEESPSLALTVSGHDVEAVIKVLYQELLAS